jgi:hypothetical protein
MPRARRSRPRARERAWRPATAVAVTYTKSGCPDLAISGVETAVFEGDRIALLRDAFDPEAQKNMGQWMAQHGAKLQG